jgi:hypothetical protein
MISSALDYPPHSMPMAIPYDYGDGTTYYPCDGMTGAYIDPSTVVPVAIAPYAYDPGPEAAQTFHAGEYQGSDYSWPGEVLTAEYKPSKSSGAPSGVIPTKRRKIIIKHLQPWATTNQVYDLIRKKTGCNADEIQQIDLPLAEGLKVNRGYARATLTSEEAAHRAIRKLDGAKHDGRTLQVEHTKEGVSEHEAVRHKGHKPHQQSYKGEREKKDKKESSRASASTDKKSKSHQNPEVIIAYGSSSSKKSDDKDKKSSRKY